MPRYGWFSNIGSHFIIYFINEGQSRTGGIIMKINSNNNNNRERWGERKRKGEKGRERYENNNNNPK